jgi:Protein of unknown function (DUF1592)/Protein of unknown function (DUF1588)/Protein of unknown function (DUF1595)/Protein of unknown function (DUF1587)/Protein of unknown function (DUF1585)
MKVAIANLLTLGFCLAAVGSVACTGVVGDGGGNGDGPSSGTIGSGGLGNPGSGGPGTAGSGPGTAGSGPQSCTAPVTPASAPMRRLTQFEYNNTLRDLAKAAPVVLPAEDRGNLFGNDAATQSVPPALVQAYNANAATVAASMTAAGSIGTLAPCAVNVAAANEATCARTAIDTFALKAYRRALVAGESDGLVQLFQTVRSSGQSFPSSLAAVLEAILQGPEFVYKPEFGVPVDGRADVLRLTGEEMAVRLSYLFWGSMPDAGLEAAAAAGQLQTPDGVKAQATRLLGDPKAHDVVRYFFDFLLPIQGLSALQRDATLYPAFNSNIGALMRTEVETFLDNEVFGSSGTWSGALTAPYTFLNGDLAAYYGIAGVSGAAFQKVQLDGVKRAGLMSLGGIVAGPVASNKTNPVKRGSLVVRTLMCQTIPLPSGDIALMVKPPADDSAPTARQRYSMHSAAPVCHACHVNMDPVGFALENLDAVGQWRDQENGVVIDASGDSPLLGTFNGPVALGQNLAASDVAQACFAKRWVDFGYGRTSDDANCSLQGVQQQFKAEGYNVQQLLVDLTQTDDFLYLPAVRQ